MLVNPLFTHCPGSYNFPYKENNFETTNPLGLSVLLFFKPFSICKVNILHSDCEHTVIWTIIE